MADNSRSGHEKLLSAAYIGIGLHPGHLHLSTVPNCSTCCNNLTIVVQSYGELAGLSSENF